MKKQSIVLIVLVIIAVVAGIIIFRQKTVLKPESQITKTVSDPIGLPDGWQPVVDTSVVYKVEKKVSSGLTPQIVLVKHTTDKATDSAKYIDKLLAGARSALPSLRLQSDKRSTVDGIYTADLSGYYYNGKNKVSLLQRLYMKGNQIYVATASYSGAMEDEIGAIFDSVIKNHLAF